METVKVQIENGVAFSPAGRSHEQDIIVEIPENVINRASELAFEEDADQVVGQLDNGEWTVRHSEDPEADTLHNAVTVTSSGVKE